ncbi:alpha/beta-hydrolase [Linderina pennispora]|uniref:Alpha/beta-hydrolase n=1 Tax=Linderina pennispora TaxID=61395 RepID=A0A1Y1VYM6_9FUNG|nr:alpha/beta-hydrolase [Linderina pennispora]ORX66369.1 alpha/beta-hydrolase [Linderina pennispora]
MEMASRVERLATSLRFHDTMLNTTWHSPNPVSDGYLAVNPKEKEIYVVWTGTRRIRSVLVDFAFVFEDFPTDIPGSAVHAGFLESTNAVYPYIVKNINSLAEDYPDYTIAFIGHSLGGASAALSALQYAKDTLFNKDRIQVWTFGEPRVGNKRFAEYYTELLGNQTYRVTFQADVVPHVPPWQFLGYQHHPLEIHIINPEGDFYVCQNTVREDLDGAYRWPTVDTSFSDHISYFGKPDIVNFDPLVRW